MNRLERINWTLWHTLREVFSSLFLFTKEFGMWIFCSLSFPVSNLFLLALFIFWQSKDIPVQSERLTYPPPLFLSPCVNYGRCGLVLHYQDPRVHPVSRRAQEQQQHSVRFPLSPVSQGHWFSHSMVTTEELTQCCHTVILTSIQICWFSICFWPQIKILYRF